MNGKGDKYRPVDPKKWDENYDRAFKKRKTVADWQKHFGDVIKSYDGFREYNQDDLLTEDEYEKGIVHCTLLGSKRMVHLTKDDNNKLHELEKEIGLNLGGIAWFLNNNPKK